MSKMPGSRPLEASVKKKVRGLLDEYAWFWWNVPMNAYAKKGISDIHAVKPGMFMVIEGKRDNKEVPTPHQIAFLRTVAGCQHFAIVVSDDTLEMFERFLACLNKSIELTQQGIDVPDKLGGMMSDALLVLTAPWRKE